MTYAMHSHAPYAVAFVNCQSQRTEYTPAAAMTIAPIADARLPARSSRNHMYAHQNATFSLRKMIAVYTHDNGRSSVGRSTNGESTAAADDPKPGMPPPT